MARVISASFDELVAGRNVRQEAGPGQRGGLM
jgi:hypothetical protein